MPPLHDILVFMTKHISSTIQTISTYSEDMQDTRVQTADPRSNTAICCGRMNSSNRSYGVGPRCDKPAKRHYTVDVSIHGSYGSKTEREEFVTTAGWCGRHDPVLKAERARNKHVKAQATHKNEQDAKARAKSIHETSVAEINELAGETIVQVGYSREYRHTTVELVGGGALKLQALLQKLTA